MVPPEAFSISAAHACVAGTSGCAGGTHSDTFMLTVLSCASAGVTLAASSSATIAFLIDILAMDATACFQYPILLISMLSSLSDYTSRMTDRESPCRTGTNDRAMFLQCSGMEPMVWSQCP